MAGRRLQALPLWLAVLAAGAAVPSPATTSADAGPATRSPGGGGGRFRAMSPRDSDEEQALLALPKAGHARDAARGAERDRVRAEVAAYLGVGLGAPRQSFVLELRPEAREEGYLDELCGETRTAGPPDVGVHVNVEFGGELSGELDDLCQRFLRHAQVKVLSEEEYEERKRVANFSTSSAASATAMSDGSNATVHVVSENTPTSAKPRAHLGVASDHTLDGVNASIREALQKKLQNLPPPPGPASYPRPGDFLRPGPLGLEQDWTVPQEPEPDDFEVVHDGSQGGKVEVRFAVGDQWGRGDGADMLLAEELRRRLALRKQNCTGPRPQETGPACEGQEGSEEDIQVEHLLEEGETLEGLRDDLVQEQLLTSEATSHRSQAGSTAPDASPLARPGATLELSESMIEALAKQMQLQHLGPVENPMNMRGLSIRRENGPGLAQLARHHWQREADLDLAKRWFRQALMCSPADVDVLVQYGLFLIEALGAYAEAQHVFGRAIAAAASAPAPAGYAQTGYAECLLHLRGCLRDDRFAAASAAAAQPAAGGHREGEELLERALERPSAADIEGFGGGIMRSGGVGVYDHYPRALTLLARVRCEVGGREGDARALLEQALSWSPSYFPAMAALGCLLARSPSPGDLTRAELLLTKVLRAHVRRLRFWALREGGSWRRDTSLAGLQFVTTRLWMTYTQTLLRRGAHANVGLARDLALDTIFYSQEMGPPPERACAGGRATAEHRQADDGLAAGDHRKGAGSAEAGAATRGGAMAEGARCCLAAMLLYDDAALLGSRFSADAFDSLGDAPGAETGASPNDNAAIDGGAVELAGEEGGSVHTSGRRCNGDGHLPCFHPGREVGAGEHAQDTGARLSVGAPGADDADALRRAARRERIREAETLLMSVFFHDDRQPTALALYGGMLWVQGRCSQALNVLAQAGVTPCEEMFGPNDTGRGLSLQALVHLLA